MSTGRLIAVVGPSGVGKDSVLTALAKEAQIALVRRDITRAPGLGGEDYRAVREPEFDTALGAGRYCLSWRAHGLGYGIPNDVLARAKAGQDMLVNLSRSVLTEAARLFPALLVINLTASPEVLARRVANRGRESAEDTAKRLARQVCDFDPSLNVHHISNDGALEDTVQAALKVLAAEKSSVTQL